jgi:peptidoglycan hydrolase-like protein with peptidoglycan-binding domain
MVRGRRRAGIPLRRTVVAAAVAGMVVLAGPGAEAADPSRADIQWAQTVLKEQGFNPGPARGEMNDRTRAALSAFQKKHGLPASGRLDAATVAKLLAIRESASQPTMGNLAAPGTSGSGGAPTGQGAAAPSAPPRVQAAPTVAVQAAGEAEESFIESVGAAPRTVVTTDDGRPAGGALPAREEGWSAGGLAVPRWVHTALYAGIAGLVLLAGLVWWRAGRPQARRAPRREDAGRDRIAPTLGPSRRGPDLRAERL